MRKPRRSSIKESNVLELSYVRVLINCDNIKEMITVWWNDAYLSIASLRGGARTSQNSSMKVAQQNNFQRGLFSIMSRKLFWFLTQQRENKRNHNLRSTSKILLFLKATLYNPQNDLISWRNIS